MTSRVISRAVRRLPLTQGARRAVAAVAAAALLVTGAGLVLGPALTAGATSPTLPFDLVPSTGSHLVFAHYFTPYPVSLDNADPTSDYYARNYLSPTGESGAHSAYGGLLRDRPLPHPARSESNWLVLNMQDEIRQAKSAGINGFTVDLLTTPTSTNTNIRNAQNNILTAADGVGGFSIMLMPDMSGSLASLTAADLASMVAGYGAHASAFKLADGRLVVSPFKAEAHPAAWWTDFMNIMATTYKMPVALVPCFLNESAYEASFAPISYGMSDWGSRNPAWNDPSATATPMAKVARVHSLGKIWMQPVSVQDERPNQSIYDEAQNTQNLRNTWQIAIASNAEWVQLTTWNDYSEGAQVAPSAQHGWTFTDLTAYYGQWFRTGVAPTIVRDAVYLTHRVQPYAATPTFAQTSLMKLRGGSPSRDTVEALSMLTAPATVSVTVGGVTTSCTAPAGVSTCTVPLQPGRAAAAVVRNGSLVASVATAQTISAKPYVQDLQYVGAGSLRDGPADPSLVGATPTPTPTTPAPDADDPHSHADDPGSHTEHPGPHTERSCAHDPGAHPQHAGADTERAGRADRHPAAGRGRLRQRRCPRDELRLRLHAGLARQRGLRVVPALRHARDPCRHRALGREADLADHDRCLRTVDRRPHRARLVGLVVGVDAHMEQPPVRRLAGPGHAERCVCDQHGLQLGARPGGAGGLLPGQRRNPVAVGEQHRHRRAVLLVAPRRHRLVPPVPHAVVLARLGRQGHDTADRAGCSDRDHGRAGRLARVGCRHR